jgi:hypothetical protein
MEAVERVRRVIQAEVAVVLPLLALHQVATAVLEPHRPFLVLL